MLDGDVVFAVRSLRKTPLFTAIVVATLAIAIAANAAVFSVLRTVVLDPLGYAHANELVELRLLANGAGYFKWSLPNLLDARSENTSFAGVAGGAAFVGTLTGNGPPRALRGARVTDGFFELFGAQPERGRFFRSDEMHRGAGRAIVLSDAAWRRVFGAAPDAVGRSATIDSVAYRIVGVAPASFVPPFDLQAGLRTDFWTIFQPPAPDGSLAREYIFMHGYARLRPGATPAGATADLKTVMDRLGQRYAAADRGLSASAVPLAEVVAGPVKPLLFAAFAAALGVLLIACANVANLLLSRAATRERELAIRFALGASRANILSQVLVETALVAVAGSVVGIVLAIGALDAFAGLHPAGIPRLDDVRFDAASALFTLAATALCAFAAGIVPAAFVSRPNLSPILKTAGRGGDASRGASVRAALVGIEIALSFALVVASVLVLRSFVQLTAAPLGFDAQDLVVAPPVSVLPKGRYPGDTAVTTFYSDVAARAQAAPGVTSAAWATGVPFSGRLLAAQTSLSARKAGNDDPIVRFDSVSPGYFETLRQPVLRGRSFTAADRATSQPVAVVNAAFAHTYFRGADVLGRSINPGIAVGGPSTPRTVVGVVGDTREHYATEPEPMIYLPLAQNADPFAALVVRSAHGAGARAAIAQAFAAADPLLAQPQLVDMHAWLARDTERTRFAAICLGALAAIALFLALAGIYAIVSYGVTMRTYEFGVRMALGAGPGHVVRDVLDRALRLAVVGIALGLVLAALGSQFLTGILYGVAPLDPPTFIGVTLAIVIAALAAAFSPALRATRVDPVIALRD